MTTNLLPIVTRKGLDTKLMKPISCLLRQISLTCAWHTLRLAPVLLAPELIFIDAIFMYRVAGGWREKQETSGATVTSVILRGSNPPSNESHHR